RQHHCEVFRWFTRLTSEIRVQTRRECSEEDVREPSPWDEPLVVVCLAAGNIMEEGRSGVNCPENSGKLVSPCC
uniref:Uncharacterized protein n=1 Tax=Anopheles minimus TaxID=112268 RepID=A0A182WPV5_9DIPT